MGFVSYVLSAFRQAFSLSWIVITSVVGLVLVVAALLGKRFPQWWPAMTWLEQHQYLIIGVGVALFLVPALLFVPYQQVEELKEQIAAIQDTVKYGLVLDGISGQFITNPVSNKQGIVVELMFRNATSFRITYQIQSISVVIDNQTVTNPPSINQGGSMPSGGRAAYNYALIDGLDFSKAPLGGIVEFTVKYGTKQIVYQVTQKELIQVWPLDVPPHIRSTRVGDEPEPQTSSW